MLKFDGVEADSEGKVDFNSMVTQLSAEEDVGTESARDKTPVICGNRHCEARNRKRRFEYDFSRTRYLIVQVDVFEVTDFARGTTRRLEARIKNHLEDAQPILSEWGHNGDF